ncbi:MAG TPA: BspA family leucine-rich repeat surface protein [Saprospiraceae bacterium]|nr:BspA family leucine-rich repeat surface protein [Saprospiraceae bacterium]
MSFKTKQPSLTISRLSNPIFNTIIKLVLSFLFVFYWAQAHSQDFITQWSFPSASTQIRFNVQTSGTVDYTWSASPSGNAGSGSFTSLTPSPVVLSGLDINGGDVVTLNMVSDNLLRFFIDNGPDRNKLTNVLQWGDVDWISMNSTFKGCQNLVITASDNPNLVNVTDMSEMFRDAILFNQDINNWNTSNVTNMHGLFRGASLFNHDLDNWNTSQVTDMSYMFYFATSYNRTIGTWNTSSVTNMSNMFAEATAFNRIIENWNTTNVTNMSRLFLNASSFNQNLNSWNTANVNDMNLMFADASSFNQPLNNWNTSNVTNMAFMFAGASSFNQDIGSWNTGNVINMSDMFSNASTFNQNLNNWNVSSVNNMSSMFNVASSFNQPLNNWNTSNVTNMAYMFSYASSFNQDIGSWNTTNVIHMDYMFGGAAVFNQDIGNWNTTNVNSMLSMFVVASSFNQDISNWDTGNVMLMPLMFAGATAFNQDISNWNTSNVVQMHSMFEMASSFNQNLGNWILHPSVLLVGMLNNSGLDCDHYSSTLIGWQSNNPTVTGLNFGALGLEYGTNAVDARDILVSTQGWTISGDAPSGVACDAILPIELISFEAIQKNDIAHLKWQTLHEVNNDVFIIEYSKDGTQFQTIRTVCSQGDATTMQEYTYEHNNLHAGQQYYRLKQIDFDGKYSYSNIESIQIKSDANQTIVFPNPTTGLIHISGDTDVSYNIINSAGIKVASGKSNQSTIQIDHLPSGLYIVLIKNERGLSTNKVWKQ